MIALFPHRYQADLLHVNDSTAVLSSGSLPHLMAGPPPQFGGREGFWSPEHLLLSAANLCLMATYLALAGKAKLAVAGYRSRVEGTLDRTPEGLRFTDVTIRVALDVAPLDRERAERLLETAKKHCIVSNALKIPVNVVSVGMIVA